VISIELIQRSVAVDADVADVEALSIGMYSLENT
jgi:hypothetical protein